MRGVLEDEKGLYVFDIYAVGRYAPTFRTHQWHVSPGRLRFFYL
jgi:hypothetical protein